MRMPFGKFKGCEIEEIPTEYLRWLEGNIPLRGSLAIEVDRVLFGNHKLTVALDRSTVKRVYRALSLEFHPDRGGSNEAMQALNRFHDELMAVGP